MYEHRYKPLLTRTQFYFRVARHWILAGAVAFVALGIGVFGYHWCEGLSWLDSLLNASMILGGMGPVNVLTTRTGKLFASAYALFSGLAFIGIMGVVLAPFAHRLIHRFHLGEEAERGGEDGGDVGG